MTAVGVQLLIAGRWTHAALVDLSLWGARLVAEDLPPPGIRAGLQMSLAGRAMRLETTVVWRGNGTPSAGLAFDPMSPAQRRSLAQAMLVASHREEAASAAILLVINGSPAAPQLAAAIRAHGFALSVSATPLEAIRLLDRPDPPVLAAIVSAALAGGAGEHMLDYLASEHPDVRRVLLLETPGEAAAIDARLADRVLLAPWTPDDVDAVFDLVADGGDRALA